VSVGFDRRQQLLKISTVNHLCHAMPWDVCYYNMVCQYSLMLYGLSYFSNSVEYVYMLMLQPECSLVQCREQIMEEEVAITMFETDKYASAVKQGRMVYQCFFLRVMSTA